MSKGPVYAMAISPHPADNDFGVGGTVAKWIKEGKEVVYVIATNGDKASSDPNVPADELASIRANEQREAAKILGVTEVVFMGHPDLGLINVPGLQKEILRLFLTFRPEVVITCDPNNPPYFSNPDHRAIGRAVLDAVWPMALAVNYYRDLMAEGLEIHRAKEMYLWMSSQPNYYNDISDVFDLKMKAVDIHQSQIGPNGTAPDFRNFLMEGNQNAGKQAGCAWAEAFHRLEVLQRL
ncbi:MAG: PIG-L family deacetylase [Dehalococcoidales bacterium]|nr:MAG: PIG-L family deacetylase [Dehalococcoidales bacterium]